MSSSIVYLILVYFLLEPVPNQTIKWCMHKYDLNETNLQTKSLSLVVFTVMFLGVLMVMLWPLFCYGWSLTNPATITDKQHHQYYQCLHCTHGKSLQFALVWIRDESTGHSSARGRRMVFPAVPHWFTAYRPCLKPWAHATFRITTFSGKAWLILKDSLPDIFAVTAVQSTVNSGLGILVWISTRCWEKSFSWVCVCEDEI